MSSPGIVRHYIFLSYAELSLESDCFLGAIVVGRSATLRRLYCKFGNVTSIWDEMGASEVGPQSLFSWHCLVKGASLRTPASEEIHDS